MIMKLCIVAAVLVGMLAISAWAQPQATVTPTASPVLTATTTPSPSAADAELDKLMKDPEWKKLVEAEKKFQPGTPEWRHAYEKEKAYMEKVAPTFSEKMAEEASIRYLRGGGDGRSSTVSVARDEVTLEAAAKAGASHDVEGMALMLQSGELFSVPVGTKVRDLGETHWYGTAKRGMLVTKVRILEGEHYRKAGWVPDQWLESGAATQR
jgi:hypothetical protein